MVSQLIQTKTSTLKGHLTLVTAIVPAKSDRVACVCGSSELKIPFHIGFAFEMRTSPPGSLLRCLRLVCLDRCAFLFLLRFNAERGGVRFDSRLKTSDQVGKVRSFHYTGSRGVFVIQHSL